MKDRFGRWAILISLLAGMCGACVADVEPAADNQQALSSNQSIIVASVEADDLGISFYQVKRSAKNILINLLDENAKKFGHLTIYPDDSSNPTTRVTITLGNHAAVKAEITNGAITFVGKKHWLESEPNPYAVLLPIVFNDSQLASMPIS